MTSRLSVLIVDCREPGPLADFWCTILGYVRGNSGESWVAIEDPHDDRAPMLAFVAVPGDRAGRTRIHVDVTPVDASRDEEVERLISLGARFASGHGDTGLITMTDPEGNEFCVMPGAEADAAAGEGAPLPG